MKIIPPGERQRMNAHPDGLKGFIPIYTVRTHNINFILIEDGRPVTRRLYSIVCSVY